MHQGHGRGRMIRKPNARIRAGLTTLVAVSAVVATMLPASAITGGEEDVENTYSNVGMIVFYQPDGRFRCSGTLISPQRRGVDSSGVVQLST